MNEVRGRTQNDQGELEHAYQAQVSAVEPVGIILIVICSSYVPAEAAGPADAIEHFHDASVCRAVSRKMCRHAAWPGPMVGSLTDKQRAMSQVMPC